jgi:hypothetical protein
VLARTLTFSLSCACTAACTRPVPPPSDPPSPSPSAPAETAAAPPTADETTSPLATIIAALVLTSPGAVAIAIEDAGPAIDACEAAHWPAELPEAIAATIEATPAGSHATVVHPAGNTTATIAGIECQAPSEGEAPIAYLRLDAPPPEGPPDPRAHPKIPSLGAREHLGVLGAKVAPTARLIDPVPLALTHPRESARREHLAARLKAIAQARAEGCQARWDADEDAHRPTEIGSAASVKVAIEEASAYELRSGEATLMLAVIANGDLTFDCTGLVETVALLLDANGDVVFELATNNSIELDWITDLDGDGIDEAMVDLTWLEDGMHEITLLHPEGDTWTSTTLWASEVP